MVMNVDVEALMEEEDKKASERPAGNYVPTFLRLKDKQKARVRPLFTVSQMVVLAMHNEFNKVNPKESINAVCSQEIGQECPYCAAAKDNKKLTATTTFMLPLYVSSIEEKVKKDGKDVWVPVTYKKDDEDIQVSGLRIIELKRFGTINDVFQFVRTLNLEDDEHDIRRYGLIIERVGGDQKTTYTILPKGPSSMPEAAKAVIPTQDEVRNMVLAACPPAGVTVTTSSASTVQPAKGNDSDFEF